MTAPILRDPKPENLTCPECDGPMVPRTSSWGKFWGCRFYPTCQGTRDSMGRSKSDREYGEDWGPGR